MKNPKHYPFPRTPHIEGSIIVDDDASLSLHKCKELLKSANNVLIQEKVDGTNVSVHFEEEWLPICQKRSGIIGMGEHEQYVQFRNWVYSQLDNLWKTLNTRYVLFGEFLLVVHSIEYDALPAFFLAFDMWDKQENYWLSWQRMQEILANTHIQTVPVIATKWNGEINELEALLQRSLFSSHEYAEGIYIRMEKDGRVLHRIKYRRNNFIAGRKDFHKELILNRLHEGGEF